MYTVVTDIAFCRVKPRMVDVSNQLYFILSRFHRGLTL